MLKLEPHRRRVQRTEPGRRISRRSVAGSEHASRNSCELRLRNAMALECQLCRPCRLTSQRIYADGKMAVGANRIEECCSPRGGAKCFDRNSACSRASRTTQLLRKPEKLTPGFIYCGWITPVGVVGFDDIAVIKNAGDSFRAHSFNLTDSGPAFCARKISAARVLETAQSLSRRNCPRRAGNAAARTPHAEVSVPPTTKAPANREIPQFHCSPEGPARSTAAKDSPQQWACYEVLRRTPIRPADGK